jgi:oligosaccharyltransferase complex subunit alpha (ribophorin I)
MTRLFRFNTDDSTTERKSSKIKYGPYKDKEAFTYEHMLIHYRSNQAQVIFTQAARTIEVSHWGNILVDEYFEIFNEAAGIKGEFGRVDYNQYDPNSALYAIKSLYSVLPSYIRGLYYWDYIGNISSSNAFRDLD